MPRSGIRLEGQGGIVRGFRARSTAGKRQTDVEVGYAAPYAVYVHENLEAFHPVGKAKYLSGPAGRCAGAMRLIITRALTGKRSVEDALVRACRFLLARSREEVPVDTGALRASGFVRVKGKGNVS